ncbi:polyprenol monophosphomannose synthase [bacterium]|nr:MAG: polyprenol monophosphomannose synthase [bacterium]
MGKVLVVIPTYNERENIEKIIKEVLRQSPDIHVLVVDDNSPDGTWEVVEKIKKKEKRVDLIKRPEKMGLGTAYVEGFKYALKNGYDVVFEMDADFSHDPNDIPRILQELNGYDMVIGSRYCNGVSVVNWPMSRLLLSYFANLFARKVTGVPIRDLTSGFKAIRRRVLEKLNLSEIRSDGYGFQIEIHVRAYRKGFKIKEIPIIFVDRRSGHSKMSRRIVWEAFWLVWWLKLQSLLRKI